MSTPAGWYPDVHATGGERYWDGQSWTNQRRAVDQPPPPPPAGPPAPPPKRKNKVGRAIGIVLAVIVAAALVTSVVQALGSSGSSPDDTSVNDGSDASNVDCSDLASEAVRISKDEDVKLLKVRNPVVKVDNRDTYSEPTGNAEALVLSCTGEGVWSVGPARPVLLRYTIDADGDTFVAYVPQ